MKELIIKFSDLTPSQQAEYQVVSTEVKRLRDLKDQMLECYKLMGAPLREQDELSDHLDIEVFTEVHGLTECKMLTTSFKPEWADHADLSYDLQEVRFCG